MSSSMSHRELLAAANLHAAPYTRRLALHLGAAAAVALLVALSLQFMPQLQAALVALRDAGAQALSTVAGWLIAAATGLWALALVTARGVSAVFVELFSAFGVATMAATMAVVTVWHRARTYVMQSAVELMLKTPTDAAEGRLLVAAFERTHKRCRRAFAALALLAVLEAYRGVLLPQADPAQTSWLTLAFGVLALASLVLVLKCYQLAPRHVAAYALFRGCQHMNPHEFTELIHSRAEEILPERLSAMRRSGLLGDGPFVVKDVLRLAARLSAARAA